MTLGIVVAVGGYILVTARNIAARQRDVQPAQSYLADRTLEGAQESLVVPAARSRTNHHIYKPHHHPSTKHSRTTASPKSDKTVSSSKVGSPSRGM